MVRRLVVVLTSVAVVAATVPARAEASHPKVLCGNFGGQTMAPHLAFKPTRCDVTRLSPGVPAVYELRHMKWTTFAKHPEGQGSVEGEKNTVRLKKKRPCGRHGQHKVYSKMSIAGGPFRPILYCGD
jgi:hypothetical protein